MKTILISTRRFSSSSNYLLWVSIAATRGNILEDLSMIGIASNLSAPINPFANYNTELFVICLWT